MSALLDFVAAHPRLLVLTGAGLSQPSGIPVYRDSAGTWLRTPPIQHADFVNKPAARQRYWARSLVGWPRMAQASPNAGHVALAQMEQAGHLAQLITQNVDGLHQRAGHRRVIDLHGNLAHVHCLQCALVLPRSQMQEWLRQSNPALHSPLVQMRPDGDADLPDALLQDVQVPDCPACGGILKPEVVFFGGTIARERVEQVSKAVQECTAVLVVGSSLTVFSGFRICRDAHAQGKPVAALNQGVTRADALLSLKVEEDCAQALAQLASMLGLSV
jgi:NAD-dependent SIR2 family protein deacetylase